GDFAVWQRRHMAPEAIERSLAFWKDTLRDAPRAIALPKDHRRTSRHAVADPAFATVDVGEAPLAALDALCRREGITLFVALCASLHALLARWRGKTDLPIATVFANREAVETEPLIGCFVNFV